MGNGASRPGFPAQNVPIETPQHYRIQHKWAQSPRFMGKTLGEIFELDGGAQALIEMSEWKNTDPNERRYIEEFMRRDPKRREVFEMVRQEMKRARKQRRGPTHAEREKQREFGF